MVDNFNLLAEFIKPNDELLTEDNFYFLQLIRRSKDTEGLSSKTFRDFSIKNSQDLLDRKSEIIEMCEFFNARAYFNPNVKSYERCATHMLKSMEDSFANKSFNRTKGMFTSAAGNMSTRDTRFEKVWIIDYDWGEDTLDMIQSIPTTSFAVPTKNGTHFLTKPFRTDTYKYADKIQKHNPTILYVK